ncbi:hypothetical protein [Streptomyces sp. NPDC000931]|uniref:hypothetical protein n=1 Tax=Streptomyces sp. NPDC000931 TaxID=3154372 RepID=UPI0033167BE6
MEDLDGVEAVVAFEDAAAFEDCPAEHRARRVGAWAEAARKASGTASVTEDEPVDAGPCRGGVSGQRRGPEDRYRLREYGPRRPRSLRSWSVHPSVSYFDSAAGSRARR